MKRVHLDSTRRVVLPADSIEEDADFLWVRSGKKLFKVPLEKVLYIEENGSSSQSIAERPQHNQNKEAPVLPVGLSDEGRPQVLGTAFSKAVQKNMSNAPKHVEPAKAQGLPVTVVLEGAAQGTLTVIVSEETAEAADTNEELVGQIFSSGEISEQLRNVRVVGFKKSGTKVVLDTREKQPVQAVNLPTALTSMMAQVGGLMSPTVRLPDIKEEPGEDT